MRAACVSLVCLLVSGCIGSTDVAPAPPAPPIEPTWKVAEPLQVNTVGAGYEPSIRVASDGTVYITAHKQSAAAEGTRLSSWLWYSLDSTTWQDMPSPQGVHASLWALEGDLAIDANDVVTFVDTYAADQTLSRWQSTPTGPMWLETRPIVATESLDDRPWLDAQGDGILYLLSNHGPDMPTPGSLLATGDPTQGDRIWFYASEDGGQTWARRQGFTGAWWCGLSASPADDHTIVVGCVTPGWLPSNVRENYLGQEVTFQAWVHVSSDRGATWASTHLADYETRNGLLYPQPAVDRAGNAYHVFVDDDTSDALPSVLRLGRPNGTTWEVLDVTPFDGSIQRIWARAGDAGHLAITFYGSPDNATTASSQWHAYAYVTSDATAPDPAWTLLALDPDPVATGTTSPADFFQNAWGPDGRLHVAYQRVRADGTGSDIHYVHVARQAPS